MNSGLSKRLALVAALVCAGLLFWYFDLGRFLTLDYLKSSRDSFAQLYAERPFTVAGVYFTVYVAVTALSLPGAAVMTLAGGALFGFWQGFLIISFASTIGATLACAAARFVLRDAVQSRFGHRLSRINEGIEQEGAFYLFTLRLVPAFPFFLINLAMGLTRMPLRTYYWISQLGMLPGTVVYVNAGRELGKIDSLSGILSPSLLASFILLGLFPLIVKKIMNRVAAARAAGR